MPVRKTTPDKTHDFQWHMFLKHVAPQPLDTVHYLPLLSRRVLFAQLSWRAGSPVPPDPCILYHYRRVAVAMTADGRGWPWKLLRLDVRGNCRGNCRGFSWVAMVGTYATDRPRHVPWPQPWHLPWKCHEPWSLPWKTADSHVSPWQHPRKSKEVPRSLPRTSAKKSYMVQPRICTNLNVHERSQRRLTLTVTPNLRLW